MPVVEVKMWAGRSDEKKQEIISGITKVFEEQGVPKEQVTVIIHDINRKNWGIGGKSSS